mgnify:CR=1 FL=1
MKNYKVVFLGSSHAGKSSIIQRCVNGQFNPNTCSTVQAGFFEKTIIVEDKEVNLDIWDTAGQERFHSLTPMYYRDSDAAIIVFDVTDANSFAKAKQWLNELRSMQGSSSNNVQIMAGNKCDLQAIRVVPTTDAVEYCKAVGVPYFETSAKTGYNVIEVFEEVGLRLSQLNKPSQQLQIDQNENKKCC